MSALQVSVMHTLDTVRQQTGVRYPQDGPASAPQAAVQVGLTLQCWGSQLGS